MAVLDINSDLQQANSKSTEAASVFACDLGNLSAGFAADFTTTPSPGIIKTRSSIASVGLAAGLRCGFWLAAGLRCGFSGW